MAKADMTIRMQTTKSTEPGWFTFCTMNVKVVTGSHRDRPARKIDRAMRVCDMQRRRLKRRLRACVGAYARRRACREAARAAWNRAMWRAQSRAGVFAWEEVGEVGR